MQIFLIGQVKENIGRSEEEKTSGKKERNRREEKERKWQKNVKRLRRKHERKALEFRKERSRV